MSVVEVLSAVHSTIKGVEPHYNVDKRNMILETKKPSKKEGFFKNSNFFNLNGSNSLTNGAQERT